jgi:hypothetical protein
VTELKQESSEILQGPFTTNTSVKIFGTDGKTVANSTKTLKFYLPYFSGSALEPEEYNSDFIRGLE